MDNLNINEDVDFEVEKQFNLMKEKHGGVADYIIFYWAVFCSGLCGKSMELIFDKLVGDKHRYDAETRRKLIEKSEDSAGGVRWSIFEGLFDRTEEEFTTDKQDEAMRKLRLGLLSKEDSFVVALDIERQALKDFSRDGMKIISKLCEAIERVEKLEPSVTDSLIDDAEEMMKDFWLTEIKFIVSEMRKYKK